MKKLITFCLLMMLAISCGENGGNAPGAATVENCAGAIVGGHCWYLGAQGDSCDDVCINHGGYSEATRTYAGQSGTQNNCMAVLDALLVPDSPLNNGGNTTCGNPIGCNYESTTRVHCISPATTSSGNFFGVERVCACNE